MLLKGRRSRRRYDLAVTAGDRIKDDIFNDFTEKLGNLVNLYGSTEMGAVATCLPTKRVTSGKQSSYVKLLTDVTMQCASTSDHPAELICHHPYGFVGYQDQQGNWLHQVHTGEGYHTGDLGYLHYSDLVEIIGRCDNSVNRSGFLVLFSEVEAAMEKLADVDKVVLISTDIETKIGQQIVAYCVAQAQQETALDAEKLRQACFDCLPKYAIPDKILILDQFPCLPNGKIDRQQLLKTAN